MVLIADSELGALLGSNLSDLETLIPGQLVGFPLGVLGLDGADTIVGSTDSELISGNQGADNILGNIGLDTLFGGQGDDSLNGEAGNDSVFGNLGQDTLLGGTESDNLFGGQGDDLLLGENGNDTLSGDLGRDTLTGGLGADTFILRQGELETDRITDFQVGIDSIQLPEGLGNNNIQVSDFGFNQTVITVSSTGEQLAILENISPDAVAGVLGIQFQPSFILREEGFLGPGDLTLTSDGSYYDEYSFFGVTGQSVDISLESFQFDTYLAIFTPNNQILEEHDDISFTNTNSQLSVTLPETGNYRIIANSYADGETGFYTLTVQ